MISPFWEEQLKAMPYLSSKFFTYSLTLGTRRTNSFLPTFIVFCLRLFLPWPQGEAAKFLYLSCATNCLPTNSKRNNRQETNRLLLYWSTTYWTRWHWSTTYWFVAYWLLPYWFVAHWLLASFAARHANRHKRLQSTPPTSTPKIYPRWPQGPRQ